MCDEERRCFIPFGNQTSEDYDSQAHRKSAQCDPQGDFIPVGLVVRKQHLESIKSKPIRVLRKKRKFFSLFSNKNIKCLDAALDLAYWGKTRRPSASPNKETGKREREKKKRKKREGSLFTV
jgi:hypothetical protein